jgi:AraC family transcriptional regulator
VRQLTRGFRVSRGCSIGDYLAQARIDMAKRRLASEESIKAVAIAMGFGSPSNFTSAFRRSTGMTPGQFRQRAAQVHDAHPTL